MKGITRAAVTLVLTCGLCVQLSAQPAFPALPSPLVLPEVSLETSMPSAAAVVPHGSHRIGMDQRSGNPPGVVRQPSSRTRLITAIAFVAGVAVFGVILRDGR